MTETKQEIQEQIKKLQDELDKLNEKIKSISNDESKPIRWRANIGECFYVIIGFGEVFTEIEANNLTCDRYYNLGNYFKTREEAEEYSDNLLTKQKLKDLALRLNDGIEIDWNSKIQTKYSIFIIDNVTLGYDYSHSYKRAGCIYCLDVNFLDKAIEEIGEDNLIRFIKSGV